MLEAVVRMRPGEIEPRTRRWKKCVTLLDLKSPLGADSKEKHEPASDIDTVVVGSLKVLDPHRPLTYCNAVLAVHKGNTLTNSRRSVPNVPLVKV